MARETLFASFKPRRIIRRLWLWVRQPEQSRTGLAMGSADRNRRDGAERHLEFGGYWQRDLRRGFKSIVQSRFRTVRRRIGRNQRDYAEDFEQGPFTSATWNRCSDTSESGIVAVAGFTWSQCDYTSKSAVAGAHE
ncbi:hypothetical protein KM043_009126 [Ampulex compressa]|nr:hypothetical protein KM043_009126 [Ampulex compressa]